MIGSPTPRPGMVTTLPLSSSSWVVAPTTTARYRPNTAKRRYEAFRVVGGCIRGTAKPVDCHGV